MKYSESIHVFGLVAMLSQNLTGNPGVAKYLVCWDSRNNSRRLSNYLLFLERMEVGVTSLKVASIQRLDSSGLARGTKTCLQETTMGQ